jgi:cellulose synthase/poly-beta-1,6-N-acetylglucosamine synthase-like glycosyltransferase
MLIFYFFAAIVICLGILSLRSGYTFAHYIRRELAHKSSVYSPFVSVIAPCRGLDEGLRENLSALFKQDYPAYEIVFVTDRADDPSLPIIEKTIEHEVRQGIATTIVVAGEAHDSGQKVHNLRVAVTKVDSRSEVLVFVDSDGRPHSEWLKTLVAPLADEQIGAATGYRWFIPMNGGFASYLRSVWNASIASALGPNRYKNFCWGGSTAIRRSMFEKLSIADAWRGTVSDDFAMTSVLQRAKLPIHFVPGCLVPSFDGCTMKELLEFSNRQLKITRVYSPHLWKPLLMGSLLFTTVFFGGLALVIVRAAIGLNSVLPLVLLFLIFLLGAAKAYVRLKAVTLALSGYQEQISRSLWAHLLLWPIASALFLWNAVVAGFSRRIEWRGITYELKSATEAVIIRR